MTNTPSPTDEDRELIDVLVQLLIQKLDLSDELLNDLEESGNLQETAAAIVAEFGLSDRAKLEEANDKLAKWLYEACGGFPVSEEAFAALAPDLPIIAREMSKPFEGRSLAEFRAEIEQKLAALNRSTDR